MVLPGYIYFFSLFLALSIWFCLLFFLFRALIQPRTMCVACAPVCIARWFLSLSHFHSHMEALLKQAFFYARSEGAIQCGCRSAHLSVDLASLFPSIHPSRTPYSCRSIVQTHTHTHTHTQTHIHTIYLAILALYLYLYLYFTLSPFNIFQIPITN